MRNYGLGSLFGIPSGANPTPLSLAVLKGVTLDLGTDNDTLRGEKLFAIDSAKKNGKIGGKIDVAQFDPKMLSLVIPGFTRTTGTQRGVRDEAGTIPATPYQVTVAQSATFLVDLGVLDTVTGLYLTRVASAPATGQYSVAAGVYTFAAADTGHAVKISYRYSVAGAGSTYTLDNSVMTVATPMSLELYGTGMRAVLPAVHIPKIGFGLKSEAWTEYGLEYEAVADANGKVAYLHFDE